MEDIKLQSPVQWVGGKKRIINNITNYIPKHFEQYHELFLGGGALLFHLKHNKSIINELNPNLINLYNVIKFNVEIFITNINEIKKEYNNLDLDKKKEYYLNLRSEYNKLKNNLVDNSTRLSEIFIFLNRTCFNSVYRENSKGEYNVPFGNGKNICFNTENIKNVSKYLTYVDLYNNDFKEQVKYIKTNDLVYMDPPYYNTFTGYNKEKWTQENSLEVLHIFKSLTEKGVAVILSNNNDQEYIKIVNDILIIDSYKIIEVSISRTLNMNISERKKKKCEILIINKYCNI